MFRERIKARYNELSPSFRKLADFVLEHQLDAALMTATELAERISVDAATVVRFAQTLGYSGFRQLSKDIQRVVKYFLKREERTVNEDFSDVQLLSRFFRVDRDLRGDKVEVRYDPFGDLESVLIYSLDGEYLDVGHRHEREEGDLKPPAPPQQPKPKYNYLDLLIQKHRQAMRRRSSGIDYQAVLAQAQRRWPLADFAKQLAAHLGRKGGISAFCTDELEMLQKIYHRLTFLNQAMLDQACARAQQRTIPEIVFHLQQLHDERRT